MADGCVGEFLAGGEIVVPEEPDCSVGYTAVPCPVGGNADLYHVNFELNS